LPENNPQEQQPGTQRAVGERSDRCGAVALSQGWILIQLESRNTQVCIEYRPDRSLCWRCVPGCCSWVKSVN